MQKKLPPIKSFQEKQKEYANNLRNNALRQRRKNHYFIDALGKTKQADISTRNNAKRRPGQTTRYFLDARKTKEINNNDFIITEDGYKKLKKEAEERKINEACKKYSKKHEIDMSFQVIDNNDKPINVEYNKAVIFTDRNNGTHYAGYYILEDGNIPCCIFFDSKHLLLNDIKEILKNKLKKQNPEYKFINIGNNLQNDFDSCMALAIKGIKTLAKKDGEIAKKILEHVKKKCYFEKSNDVWFGINGLYIRNVDKKDIHKLEDIPYAGEFIKLAQSHSLQEEIINKYPRMKVNRTKTYLGEPFKIKENMSLRDYLKNHEKEIIINGKKKTIANKSNNVYKKIMGIPVPNIYGYAK